MKAQRLAWILITIGAIGIIVGLLLGCAPESGTVVDKRHTPATSTIECVQRDPKTNQCTMQQPRQIAPKWELRIRSDDGKTTGWLEVSESTYKRYDVGDHYPERR